MDDDDYDGVVTIFVIPSVCSNMP